MSKSLTHNHALLLNEREQLDAKIRELETQLGDGIVTLIKQHQGFKIPYPLLCALSLISSDHGFYLFLISLFYSTSSN
ncbi:MAG: hypothetical protein K0M45_01625 [Candidatus Paracaedibacteraceae bacterium]|nr:hypothetical protein [Candidatus Paracaedibacteraceae bacterium]